MNSTLLAVVLVAAMLGASGAAIAPTYCFGVNIGVAIGFLFDFVSDPEAIYDVDLDYVIDYAFRVLECN